MKISYRCAICNKEFIRLLPHLRSKSGNLRHGITPEEYHNKYISNGTVSTCVICGSPASFDESKFAYNEFCENRTCRFKVRWEHNKAKLKERTGYENQFQIPKNIDKIKQTCLEKYGVSNFAKTNEHHERTKNTCLKKYGVEFIVQSDAFKQKSKQTCLDHYGVEYSQQSPEIRQKGKVTRLLKYGDENYNNSEKTRKTNLENLTNEAKRLNISIDRLKHYQTIINNADRQNHIITAAKLQRMNTVKYVAIRKTLTDMHSMNTNFSKFGTLWYTQCEEYKMKRKHEIDENILKTCASLSDYEHVSHNEHDIELKHLKCGKTFNITRQSLYIRQKCNEEICLECNPYSYAGTSKVEKELYDYITSITSLSVKQNVRNVLTEGKELDIYIPEKKLAIEFDGLYWHNELHKDKNYHVNKTDECEKQGIQLIHVFEDEWLHQPDIVKSRISGLLGLNERIYARKTAIRELTYDESKYFLEENHIQGNCVSTYRYGLFYRNEIVSVMTFGPNRFKKNEFELLRFANKLNTNVIGGASKLFKHFLNDHPEITEVTSYADRRWSIGNLYEKIGFIKDSVSSPSYFYVIGDTRENRIKYQKHKLVKEGYDSNKTEHEIMLEREIYRIYDCGNIKYTYYKKS